MSAATPESNGPDGRDSRGKFATGNRHGRGNPAVMRLASLQSAVRGAIGPADLRTVLHKLRDLATAGDVAAASVLLTRVLGRPRETPTSVLIDLPALTNAADIVEALRRVAASAAAGEIALDEAAQVVALVRCVADATVLEQVERRVAELESRNHR